MPRELLVSPRGEAQWAKVLGEPVAFEDNPKAWSVSLLLDPNDPEVIEFIEKLDTIFQELHGSKAKVSKHGYPYREETTTDDKGREIKTGKVEVRFKKKELTAKGLPKDPPVVVDAKKNRWPQDKLIGNGSIIKVAFEYYPWEMAGAKGLSLELQMVQVLTLVEYSKGASVDAFAEEDGYTLPAEVEEAPFTKEEEPTGFAAQLRARAAQVQAESADVLAKADESEIPF